MLQHLIIPPTIQLCITVSSMHLLQATHKSQDHRYHLVQGQQIDFISCANSNPLRVGAGTSDVKILKHQGIKGKTTSIDSWCLIWAQEQGTKACMQRVYQNESNPACLCYRGGNRTQEGRSGMTQNHSRLVAPGFLALFIICPVKWKLVLIRSAPEPSKQALCLVQFLC